MASMRGIGLGLVVLALVMLCFIGQSDAKMRKKNLIIPNDEHNMEVRDPSCPNNCNKHGRCDFGTCVCDTHYGGSDCSYLDDEIQAGQVLNGSVNFMRWQYYHIAIDTPSNLAIWVNESKRFIDCDIYIQRNAFPTRSSYDSKNSGSNRNSYLQRLGAEAGTWYIGVYGASLLSCHFSIQVLVDHSCPSSCSGHGTCNNGVCTCDSGWTGPSCSVLDNNLQNGVTSPQTSVNRWQWRYYTINITAPASVLNVTVVASSGDPDLYIKRGKMPSAFNSDAYDVTIGNVATVTLQLPAVDVYYVGVFGFKASVYTITATWQAPTGACASQCSLHGTCMGGVCACSNDFSGVKCENRTTPLVVDSTGNVGFVSKNDWNYYYFQYTSNNAVKITVTQSGAANEDCDLYVRKNQYPTRFAFDLYSIGNEQTFSVNINTPGTFTWYIGIFGWKDCQYNINLEATTPTTQCPNNCNGHGTCTVGRCVCFAGYTGTDCSTTISTVTNNGTITSRIGPGQWQYYSFTASTTNAVVSLKEDDTEGYMWLFLNKNPPTASEVPTLSTYTAKNDSQIALHSVRYSSTTQSNANYVVGVYASPYFPQDTPEQSYKLNIYFTPF